MDDSTPPTKFDLGYTQKHVMGKPNVTTPIAATREGSDGHR